MRVIRKLVHIRTGVPEHNTKTKEAIAKIIRQVNFPEMKIFLK